MSQSGEQTPHVDIAAWWLLRGKNDGDHWAVNESDTGELIVWADISDFEHYMGQLPFPYHNAAAVQLYETARSDASAHGITFSHQHYVGGFLEAVYDVCRTRLGLDR